MERFMQLGRMWPCCGAPIGGRIWAEWAAPSRLARGGYHHRCVIGLACGILNTIPYTKYDPLPKRFLLRLVRILVRIYVEVFRGTPMVLQAVFIYYGLPYFSTIPCGLTTSGGGHPDRLHQYRRVYGRVGPGRHPLHRPGQTEGAKAIGMNHFQTMTSVILPQAFRNILPQIGNNFIINIKDTSVMFIIGFTELFAYHRYITRREQHVFPPRRPSR